MGGHPLFVRINKKVMVKGKVAIYSSELIFFAALEGIGDHPIYRRYDALRDIINVEVDDFYRHFLAQPVEYPDGVITWYCLPYSETPRHLDELSGSSRVKYYAIKDATIGHYKRVMERLKNENKTIELEYLEKALKTIDDRFIYCFDEKIVLTAWGMKAKNSKDRPSGEYTRDLFVATPKIEEEPLPAPPQEKPERPVPEPNEFEFKAEMEEDPADDDPDDDDSSDDDGPGLPHWSFFLRGKGGLKWMLSLLLLLLLIWLSSFLFGTCRSRRTPIPGVPPLVIGPGGKHGGGHVDPGGTHPGSGGHAPGGGYTFLPRDPGLTVPVDSVNFAYSKDSLSRIVADRLNILIEKEVDLFQFAKDLKTVYPSNDYQIIYYDTLIKRLQIKVPVPERENVKRQLPEKLKNYKLFIWDETLFETLLQLNDPALQDKDKSWQIKACQVSEAWDYTLGSPDVVVAIVDEGFDLGHPELKGKIVKPYNVWTKDRNVYPSKSKHGTHVAGIALAAGNNGIGIAGIAPNCSFMPVQVADNHGHITITSAVDGILYAIYSGADVVNVSMGMDFTRPPTSWPADVQGELIRHHFKEEERLWKEVFRIAEEHNTTIVVAAGNEDILAGIDPLQRPPQAITVSAVNKTNKPYSKTTFSNFGSYSTLSAPGLHIYSTYGADGYKYLSGTSMAAPIVTGAVALLKSIDRKLTTQAIKNILVSTGIPISGNVGNMIQIGKAMRVADCYSIHRKIDSLKKEIESLSRKCPQINKQ